MQERGVASRAGLGSPQTPRLGFCSVEAAHLGVRALAIAARVFAAVGVGLWGGRRRQVSSRVTLVEHRICGSRSTRRRGKGRPT
jgi:hypothetical protein